MEVSIFNITKKNSYIRLAVESCSLFTLFLIIFTILSFHLNLRLNLQMTISLLIVLLISVICIVKNAIKQSFENCGATILKSI